MAEQNVNQLVESVDLEAVNLPSTQSIEDGLDLEGRPTKYHVNKIEVSYRQVDTAIREVQRLYPEIAQFARIARAMLCRLETLRDEAVLRTYGAKFTAEKSGDSETAKRLQVLLDMLGKRNRIESLYLH